MFDIVQLLARCEAKGIELLNAGPTFVNGYREKAARANSRDEEESARL
jgi:hypothetical protein